MEIDNEKESYIGVCVQYDTSGKVKVIPAGEFSMESFSTFELSRAREYDFQPLLDGNCFLDYDERYEFAGY